MRRRVRLLWIALIAVAAVALLAFVLRYVPFSAPSFTAWGGIGLTFAGLAALARPLKGIGIPTRRRALACLGCGVVAAVTAIAWPAPLVRSARPHQRIDDFLPEYQFREYHEVRVRASAGAVLAAMREVSLADMPVAVLLLRARGAASGNFRRQTPDHQPLLDMMLAPGSGFLALDLSDPSELVLGMAGFTHAPRPPLSTPEQFVDFTGPGGVRVAFNLRVEDQGDGIVRVSTETRCLGNDPGARRVFARYWRIIYPGSAIIRQVWLDAIVARARQRAQGDPAVAQRAGGTAVPAR
jgi:hypothetical protein